MHDKISGVPQGPRLSVFGGNKQTYARVIGDIEGRILANASLLEMETSKTRREVTVQVGQKIARVVLATGIDTMAFNRNGYLYHGYVKELASAARAGGLEF